MHPMMIMAVAREGEWERQRDRQELQLRSLALASRAQGVQGWHRASRFARGLLVGFGPRPRFS
jgi:hypothetical protein